MNTLFYMVGLVGAGKGFIVQQYIDENTCYLSSDDLRAELLGNDGDQSNNSLIFNEMQNRTICALNEGKNVVYDACNIWSKKRIQFLKDLRRRVKVPFKAKCILVLAPIEVCFARNAARQRTVPDYVITRQLRQFNVPYLREGWDVIDVVHNYTVEEGQKCVDFIMNKVYDFGSQNNEHHSLSLFDHNVAAYQYAEDNNFSATIKGAALNHDIGKAWTAEYWAKDNGANLHFPNHANVSAYLSLLLGMNINTALLIEHHMDFYMDECAQATWRARLGDEIWNELTLLHECDEAAH